MADETPQVTPLQSRAYQVEMLDHAMRANTIVAMDTGSGKTQIAKLRIEAELERSPQKFWSTQHIWNTVLDKIDVVISTPQVLLDALSHGFVRLQQISLLVFDEAHHATGRDPTSLIMQQFYQPLEDSNSSFCVPHILGLTASPVTNSASMLNKLETNLNAICKSPKAQLEEYKRHVYLPTIERLPFAPSTLEPAGMLQRLNRMVSSLNLADDPTVKWLQGKAKKSIAEEQKLFKILSTGRSKTMRQIQSFVGHVEHIYHSIGLWAADLYCRTCASRLHNAVLLNESVVSDLVGQEQQYIDVKLQNALDTTAPIHHEVPKDAVVASKARAVINYLANEYRPGITVIIFVKRRSVAFALTQLLQCSPQMQGFEVFSFVGTANSAHRTLADLMDPEVQKGAYAQFQHGSRNLCVATQVMEEGVDIQATNLVIRFDEPETFRSFIQSRGRARQPNSKFVVVHPASDNDSAAKMTKWHELERMMKEQYDDSTRSIVGSDATEDEDEGGGETYSVSATGAVLTYNNARQHLEHFCTTLPSDEDIGPARPVFITDEIAAGLKSVKVVLPSCLPALLQTTNSLRTWRSEKMASKDAAFQAYKNLHTARLVNDNLLPFARAKKVVDTIESRASTYDVKEAIDPWNLLTQNLAGDRPPSCLHLIQVSGVGLALPDMIVILPTQLEAEFSFRLYSTVFGRISVTVGPYVGETDVDLKLAHQVTHFLFAKVLGRRIKKVDASQPLPYFIIPATGLPHLSSWFQQVQRTWPLSELTFNDSLERASYLLQYYKQEVLYIWSPTFDGQSVKRYIPEDGIMAERMSTQLSLFDNTTEGKMVDESIGLKKRALPVRQCQVQGLSPAYASFMLLMPSIQHKLTLALRGQLAMRVPLSAINFNDINLVTKALTSSSASSEYNYETLEFLGDSLLKYYASVQVYFDHPDLTEEGLSTKYAKIVNNARLQRTTRDLELDAYITTQAPSGMAWTLNFAKTQQSHRRMSSKTLADVIEALIGVAHLDSKNFPDQDAMSLAALSLFFPDIAWKTPTCHIEGHLQSPRISKIHVARLEAIESILNYEFSYKALLLEALTHTTLRAGLQSFQRLEFLGDAILDRIVNATLYNSCLDLDPEQSKFRSTALVNRWTLAFLAMVAHHLVESNEVVTTTRGHSTISRASRIVRLVDHIHTLSNSKQQNQRSRAETSFLDSAPTISTAFSTGKTFPWLALHSIDAPKMYSDIIESILAAVFIDSGGSLAACEKVLESLGLMQLLRRLVTEPDIEIRQPIVQIRLMYPDVLLEEKDLGKIKDGNRRWIYRILIEGELIATGESTVSRKHAEACAAVLALEKLKMKEKRTGGGEAPDGKGEDGAVQDSGSDGGVAMDLD